MSGAGIFSPREDAPPSVRKFLKEYAAYKWRNVTICRKPIISAINSAINLAHRVGFGKPPPYDKLFHLYINAVLESPAGNPAIFSMERNQTVKITQDVTTGGECKSARIDGTISSVFDKAIASNSRNFWIYVAVADGGQPSNNCQDFVISVLEAGGHLTPELREFVKQDTRDLIPSLFADLGKRVTDLASGVDKLLFGKGFEIQALQFPVREQWSARSAREWMRRHGIAGAELTLTVGGSMHFDMRDPRGCYSHEIRKIRNGPNVVIVKRLWKPLRYREPNI